MSDLLASITVISVVNDEKPAAAGIERFSSFLATAACKALSSAPETHALKARPRATWSAL